MPSNEVTPPPDAPAVRGYRILSKLGEGGFGAVYRAERISLDLPVAIKVIKTTISREGSTHLERFKREARMLARMQDHENIVDVYDLTEDDAGNLCIVMQFIEGETLGDRLDRQARLPLPEAIRIVSEVAGALDFAHSYGVVHRDVKPDNIMITRSGRVKVMDFGVSRHLGSTTLSATGLTIGTPYYMSPEQWQGDRSIDHRSDIYALSVLLYQLATGQLPFEAEDPFALGMQHVHKQPPSPREVEPDLPEELETIILRGLAKRPDDRFQKAGELREALQAFLSQKDFPTLAPGAPGAPLSLTPPKPGAIVETKPVQAETFSEGSFRDVFEPASAERQPLEEQAIANFEATRDPRISHPPSDVFASLQAEADATAGESEAARATEMLPPARSETAQPKQGRSIWPWVYAFLIIVPLVIGGMLHVRSRIRRQQARQAAAVQPPSRTPAAEIPAPPPRPTPAPEPRAPSAGATSPAGLHPEDALRRGLELWNEPGRRADAVPFFERALDGKIKAANYYMALVYEDPALEPTDPEAALRHFQVAADGGDENAQYALGKRLIDGSLGEKNEFEGLRWMLRAADAGQAEANERFARDAYRMGELFDHGVGGAYRDDRAAVTWYRRAAAAGSTDAMNRLGLIYGGGIGGVRPSKVDAVRWYIMAAQAGDPRGMYNLATMYEKGEGTLPDQEEALRWYLKAAEAGYVEAMIRAGEMLAAGRGAEQNKAEAVRWYRKAAESGDPHGMANLARALHYGEGLEQNHAEAAQWYRKAADSGEAGAMTGLGILYDDGLGLEEDNEAAVEWFRRAAERRDAEAIFRLGRMYEKGEGVERDYAKAIVWYETASDGGSTMAMKRIGEMHDQGIGMREDNVTAVRWFRRAAEAGDPGAMEKLGDKYAAGEGTLKDTRRARQWYQQAAGAGNAEAARKLAELRR